MPIHTHEHIEKRLRALPGYVPPRRVPLAKPAEPVAKKRGGRVSKARKTKKKGKKRK